MIIEVNGKEMEAISVNGRSYPLWSKFCLDPSWIGGTLEDLSEGIRARATITKIVLEPNGKDSAIFEVQTDEGWSCASDVRYLGVGGQQQPGWLEFSGFAGQCFRIQKPERQNQ